jgi:hypothetical protein
MNLRDALYVWRRRWLLTLLLIVLILALSVAAAMKAPRHYSAESDVVLLPSAASTVPNGHNPYLTYNGSLPMTAQILSYQLMAPQTIADLVARGYTASFTATLAVNAAGAPILSVVVTGSNKTTVENTLHGVTAEIATKLSALQTGITRDNQITASTLSVAANPSLSTSKTARPVVIVLVLGLVLALAIPLVVDGAARRRSPDVNSSVSGRISDRTSLPTSRSLRAATDAATPLRSLGNSRRQISDRADPTFGADQPGSSRRRSSS